MPVSYVFSSLKRGQLLRAPFTSSMCDHREKPAASETNTTKLESLLIIISSFTPFIFIFVCCVFLCQF